MVSKDISSCTGEKKPANALTLFLGHQQGFDSCTNLMVVIFKRQELQHLMTTSKQFCFFGKCDYYTILRGLFVWTNKKNSKTCWTCWIKETWRTNKFLNPKVRCSSKVGTVRPSEYFNYIMSKHLASFDRVLSYSQVCENEHDYLKFFQSATEWMSINCFIEINLSMLMNVNELFKSEHEHSQIGNLSNSRHPKCSPICPKVDKSIWRVHL